MGCRGSTAIADPCVDGWSVVGLLVQSANHRDTMAFLVDPGCRAEIKIARDVAGGFGRCLSGIARTTLVQLAYIPNHFVFGLLRAHVTAPWPRGWRNDQYAVKFIAFLRKGNGSWSCRACCIYA